MNIILIAILIFSQINYVQAQDLDNSDIWSNEVSSDIEEPSYIDFSVSIPTESVDLVIASLCASTGSKKECTPEEAKKVVIQFINDQVATYKRNSVTVDTINIQ